MIPHERCHRFTLGGNEKFTAAQINRQLALQTPKSVAVALYIANELSESPSIERAGKFER